MVPQHGQDDVAAPAGQADDRGVMAFAVEPSCGRPWTPVRKGCKSGQEHGVLQSVVTTCSRTGLSPGRGNRPVSLHRCTMTRSASRRVAVCVQAVARALMGPLERNRQTCSKDDENHERPVPRNSPTPPVKPP